MFPVTSVLYGETHIINDKWLIEYELGLALPALATGKLGVGMKLNDIKFIAGVRPFPFNIFYQMAFETSRKGDLIMSFEFSPLGHNSAWALNSSGNINVGHSWNINSRGR